LIPSNVRVIKKERYKNWIACPNPLTLQPIY
jgi:hypothetical protein